MSDNLENFIRNNRDKFDSQVPNNQVWNNIQAGIAQQAATTAATTTAATTAKSGLAKIALGWKIAALAAFTAIVATGIYYVSQPADSKQDGKTPEPIATTTTNATNTGNTTQAEYLYEGSAVVTPPFAGVDVPYLTFNVDAQKGGNFTAPSGSEIKIPAGLFVDAQGVPVAGDVQIRYREFHDAEDVIVSGITMQYRENGAKEDFQTAGMLEILGYQGERAVYIAPGKSLDIKMASFTPEDNYDLFFLDNKDGWKDIGKAKLSKNKEKEEGLLLLAAKPRPPVKSTSAEMDGEVMFNANFDKFPELKPFKGVRWMAEDKAAFKAKEDKLISKVWSDVKLEELDDEGLRYRITLSHKSKATMSIDVKPILEGDDYAKGMERFKEKMDKYNKVLKAKNVDADRLVNQADVYRTFTVSGFGIYNCDRFYGGNPIITMRADYNFSDDDYVDPNRTVIYHIIGNNRGVLTLMPGEREFIKYMPKDDNYLVVVLPGNRVGVFGPDEFAKLDPNSGSNAQINFKKSDQEVLSATDLRKALGV
jgi:hypothetical protein